MARVYHSQREEVIPQTHTLFDLLLRLTGTLRTLLLCKKLFDLGFGPWPQLLQFLGSCFNSCRCSQQLILSDNSRIDPQGPPTQCLESAKHTKNKINEWS